MRLTIFLIIFILFSLIIILVHELTKMPKEFQFIQFDTDKEEILIGVISDTHVPSRAKSLSPKVKEIFKDVDLIIHAGDIESLEVLGNLKKIAPVIAVYGNMDPSQTREKLSSAICIKIYNWRIGVLHDSIAPWLEWEMRKLAEQNNFNILIFGHIHRPFLKEDGILILNPGSPTNPIFAKPSVAILKITKDSYQGKIIYFGP